jgi:hypothetical protein
LTHDYLIGDPISDFSDNEAFTSTTGKSALINGSSSAAGPAALGSPPTITFGGLATGGSSDIDENGTGRFVMDLLSISKMVSCS